MRVSNPGSSRPAYYDRNPTTTDQHYRATVGPAALTIRVTYTVPTGRKSFIEMANAVIYRATVATTPGTYQGWTGYNAQGGNGVDFAANYSIDNTQGANQKQNVGTAGTCIAGDQVQCGTFDQSTGGLVTYDLGFKYIEFDA